MIDKIGAIVIKNGKMLIVKEKDISHFFIPGGKRDNNETDEETLKRELKEETGLLVKSFRYYKEFITKAQLENENVKVASYFCETNGEPEPNEEIEEIIWIGRDNYKDIKIGNVLKVMIPELIKDGFL